MTGSSSHMCLSHQFDLGGYDRSSALTERERARIAAVAAGESLHVRLCDPLGRLMEPLKACFQFTKAQQSQYSLLRHLIAEIGRPASSLLGMAGTGMDGPIHALQGSQDGGESAPTRFGNGNTALSS